MVDGPGPASPVGFPDAEEQWSGVCQQVHTYAAQQGWDRPARWFALTKTPGPGVLFQAGSWEAVDMGSMADPVGLLWGRTAPSGAGAVVGVWESWALPTGGDVALAGPGKSRSVVVVTRNGQVVRSVARPGVPPVVRDEVGADVLVTALLCRTVGVPAPVCELPVGEWLGRLVLQRAAAGLLALGGEAPPPGGDMSMWVTSLREAVRRAPVGSRGAVQLRLAQRVMVTTAVWLSARVCDVGDPADPVVRGMRDQLRVAASGGLGQVVPVAVWAGSRTWGDLFTGGVESSLFPQRVKQAGAWCDAELVGWMCAQESVPQRDVLRAVRDGVGRPVAEYAREALVTLGWAELGV